MQVCLASRASKKRTAVPYDENCESMVPFMILQRAQQQSTSKIATLPCFHYFPHRISKTESPYLLELIIIEYPVYTMTQIWSLVKNLYCKHIRQAAYHEQTTSCFRVPATTHCSPTKGKVRFCIPSYLYICALFLTMFSPPKTAWTTLNRGRPREHGNTIGMRS